MRNAPKPFDAPTPGQKWGAFCQLAKQPRRNSVDTGVCELIVFSMPHCFVVLFFSKRQEIRFSDATFKDCFS